MIAFSISAQRGGGGGRGGNGERMQEFKKQYLEEQLNLSGDKADAFWKVYDQYETERKTVRKEMKQLKNGFIALSDAELEKAIEKSFVLKEKEVAIDKKYFKEFQKVLTIRQVAALYHAEKQMVRMILEKIRNGGGGMPEDFDDGE